MKILFIGDIVGKIGRRGLAAVLPDWKKEYQPDLVIANVENIAHGIGLTRQTLEEVRRAGVDFFTTGNHWADKDDGIDLFRDSSVPLVRPANWPGQVPGAGYKVIEVGATPLAIINLLGQMATGKACNSPFEVLDEILDELGNRAKIKIVDFQAEMTSEKQALAWYADGRVSAVLGTHTHVPTADVRTLPQGTAYVTDVGMVGAVDSIIGDRKEEILAMFLDQIKRKMEIPESGEVQVNAVVMEADNGTGRAQNITRLDTITTVL